MVLDKKQIRSIFVLGFKMGPIGAKTTHNINDAFGPGTANKHTVQWWFKFCKGDESLEDKEHSGRPWEGDKEQPRTRADPLPTTGEVATKLDVSHSTAVWYLQQVGRWESSDDQLSVWTKEKLQSTCQSQTCTKKKRKKKVPVTVWWSATRLVYCSFLYPCETITYEKCAQQIDEMHQKLQCLQPALVNRKAQFFSSTTPSCTLQNQHFKTSTNWATRLRLLRSIHLTSHRLTTTSSSILATFFRENASTTSRRPKMLSKGSSNHEA